MATIKNWTINSQTDHVFSNESQTINPEKIYNDTIDYAGGSKSTANDFYHQSNSTRFVNIIPIWNAKMTAKIY